MRGVAPATRTGMDSKRGSRHVSALCAVLLCASYGDLSFFAAQIVTGSVLYAQGSETPATLRFTHGVVMWVILAFFVHHIYSAILIGAEERSAMVAGIVTGNKKLTDEHLAAAGSDD